MKVKRSTLLLLACLVWCIAGFNILRIGIWLILPMSPQGIFFCQLLSFLCFKNLYSADWFISTPQGLPAMWKNGSSF